MRRQNSLGNWRGSINNYGALFNQSDSIHLPPLGAGGLWYSPQAELDTVVFGAGIWIGGLRRSGDSLVPHVEYSYDPNNATSVFVPGSLIYDGPRLDTSQSGRDKYRVYRSTDLTGPAWPLRTINGTPHYVDDVASRVSVGPPSTFGDEDMLIIYKDTDPILGSVNRPFGLEVRSQISFWNRGLLKDVVVVHNEILYSGKDTIYKPIVALALDGDIQWPEDDRLKGVQTEGAAATIFFTDHSTVDPMLGVILLQGQHGRNRLNTGLTSLRYWDILDDPTDDSSRYAFLIKPAHDTALSKVGDARVLMTSLSEQSLIPGDTLYFDYALFVKPASGRPALSQEDSTNLLNLTQTLLSHYYTGTFGQLDVPEKSRLRAEISLYPNPVSTLLHIAAEPHEPVSICNILGETIHKTEVNPDREIDVSMLRAGVYYVKVGENGDFERLSIIR